MKVWRDSLVGLIRLTLEKNRPVNSSDLRFGLIGAGRWGKVYIKTLERMDGFELVRLASTNPNAKKLVNSNFSHEFNITYHDMKKMGLPVDLNISPKINVIFNMFKKLN